MPDLVPRFTPPAIPILRWLMDAGPNVPERIRIVLLGEIFAAPNTVIAGIVNGLAVNGVGLYLRGGRIFLFFMLIDIVIVTLRVGLVTLAIRRAARHARTPTDLYLVFAILWCALQGTMAFSAMQVGSFVLQVLATTTIMGLIGPICGRNYVAPRYAILLICLCDFPFVVGAVLTGEPWMLLLVLQTPLFLIGTISVLKRFHRLSLAVLLAEDDSHRRAQHDSLTGLLNRSGLAEALSREPVAAPRRFAVLCLDLDGFKNVNDTFGHQAGDDLLRAVAARLKSCIRATDILARLGGDEFVIVAPGLSPADSARFANSIIDRIMNQPCVIDAAGVVPIGISVGFACAPEDGVENDDLRGKADAALYLAKRAGKGTQRRFSVAAAGAVLADVLP